MAGAATGDRHRCRRKDCGTSAFARSKRRAIGLDCQTSSMTSRHREILDSPSRTGLLEADVATAAQLACLLEASAPKPGNVSPGRHFADARYEDFLASAAAVGIP